MTTGVFIQDVRQQSLQPAYWTQGMRVVSFYLVREEDNSPFCASDEPEGFSYVSETSDLLSLLERSGEFDYLKGESEDVYDLSDGDPI